jgi:uncharacterized protein
MTTLKERISNDLTAAMRARDEVRKSALRMLITAIRNAEIPPEGATEPPEKFLVDDAGVTGIVLRQVKQRRDSIDQFGKAGRQDLVAKEQTELEILLEYGPKQATREEIEAAARAVLAETGASGVKDIGKVMPVLTKQFAGRADGRMVNEVVRALLGP